MSESQNRVSPIVAIAAVSVIVFSAVGVGVMTGVIPSSLSKSAEQQVAATSEVSKGPAAAAPTPAAAEKKTASSAPNRAPVSEAPKRTSASEPVRVATAPSICTNCGTVEAVNIIEQKGEGSGLGAIAGGVAGAVLGNQIGGGSGRKIATVAGAAGGAFAGHQVEKQVKSTSRFDVAVRMQDGTSRNFSFDSQPAFRAGDKVRVVDGTLVAN